MATTELRGISKSFGSVRVIEPLDLTIESGTFTVIVGPSGCGKSTLLRIIAGLETASGGTIHIDGVDVSDKEPSQRGVAMVFQTYALYPHMSVRDNMSFGLEMAGMAKPEREALVLQAAQTLQLEDYLDRKPKQLSGGQRQRVAIGRTIVRNPKVFLFDEPLSNLDAKLRVEVRGEIRRLHERLDASIVYVTHDQIEAMTLGTRIVVLNQGVIQQIGTPEEIYERPANLFVADFMGSPPMNLVPGSYSKDADAGSVGFDGHLARLPATIAGLAEGPVVVGIRPESFIAAEPGGGMLTLTAKSVENAGSDTYVAVELGGTEIIARLPGRMHVHAGDSVPLDVDLATLCFFDPQTEQRID